MNKVLNVLCLEDSPRDAEILREFLTDARYDLNMDCTATEKEFVSLLRSHKYDLILSDFKLPGFDGFTALRWSVEICPDVPFICISGTVGEVTAVELLKKGAVDYILKDRLERLPSAIERALDEAKEKKVRQKAEETLRESERKLREAQELAHLGFWHWDINTGDVEWSEEVFKIFCLDSKEFTPHIDSILALSPWPEDHQRDKELINKAIETHTPGSYEQKFLRPDQSIGHYYSTFQGNFDDNGDLVSIVGTVLDITEQKKDEETISSLARFPAENPDPVMRVGYDGRLLYANEASYKLLTWKLKIGNKVPTNLLKILNSVLKDGVQNVIDTEHNSKIISFSIVPFVDAGYVNLYGKDITDKKRAEGKIIQLNNELEQKVIARTVQLDAANKELEAFAYSVSHDLRAPLRAIDGFSKFVLEDYENKLDSEGKRLLNLIRSNIQKMDQLITDLLALSRVARCELNFSGIDMTQMAISMFNEIKTPYVPDKISLKVDTLPEAYADPTYIRQVWANLIANAIKFSSKEKKPSVKIYGRTENGFNVYYVKDNGVGFNPEYAHKLFGVFQRLHKSDDFEGTGVGLAIIQRIIHRHGGNVWAEGKEGNGATFWFSLPVKN